MNATCFSTRTVLSEVNGEIFLDRYIIFSELFLGKF